MRSAFHTNFTPGKRFRQWLKLNLSRRIIFDVGIQTANAISELKRGVHPFLAGGTDEFSNGNDSLMRVLPLAICHQGTDLELVADAFDRSTVTHGHLRAFVGKIS